MRLTQTLDGLLNTGVPPVTFAAYIVIPSLPILLVVTFFLSIFGALANYPWGRSLLLNYPSIFSAGLVSHAGPTPEQLAASSFTSTLVARGHTKPLLDGATQGSRMGPDVRVTTRVTGPEVGYVSTPICYITAARVILNERKKVSPAGENTLLS